MLIVEYAYKKICIFIQGVPYKIIASNILLYKHYNYSITKKSITCYILIWDTLYLLQTLLQYILDELGIVTVQ